MCVYVGTKSVNYTNGVLYTSVIRGTSDIHDVSEGGSTRLQRLVVITLTTDFFVIYFKISSGGSNLTWGPLCTSLVWKLLCHFILI